MHSRASQSPAAPVSDLTADKTRGTVHPTTCRGDSPSLDPDILSGISPRELANIEITLFRIWTFSQTPGAAFYSLDIWPA